MTRHQVQSCKDATLLQLEDPVAVPLLCALCSAGVAGPPESSSEVYVAQDLTAFDFKQLKVQAYQAVLINTGWEVLQQQQQQQQQQAHALQQQVQQRQQHSLDCDKQQQQEQDQQQPDQQNLAGPGPSSQAAAAAAAATAAQSSRSGVASWGHGSSAHAWQTSSSSSVVSRLEGLPIPTLCPRGFIFIWANKEHLSGWWAHCSGNMCALPLDTISHYTIPYTQIVFHQQQQQQAHEACKHSDPEQGRHKPVTQAGVVTIV